MLNCHPQKKNYFFDNALLNLKSFSQTIEQIKSMDACDLFFSSTSLARFTYFWLEKIDKAQ